MTDELLDPGVRGPDTIRTRKRGIWLLKNPSTNKGLGYTPDEREQLGLHGLLPPTMQSIEQQVSLGNDEVDPEPAS